MLGNIDRICNDLVKEMSGKSMEALLDDDARCRGIHGEVYLSAFVERLDELGIEAGEGKSKLSPEVIEAAVRQAVNQLLKR